MLVRNRGFNGDIAVDFDSAAELLMVFETMDFFEEGSPVHVFHGFHFHHAFSAQPAAPAIEEFVEAFVHFGIVIKGGLP